MDTAVELSIIIVNWRSVEYLRQCLGSIVRETVGLSYEVVVVDNASADGCGDMLAREFPNVAFIQSATNLGFSGANNLGARRARGRAFLFLNPDTEILDNAVGVLYQQLIHLPGSGVLGCRLLNTDRTVQTSAVQSFPTILNQLVDADMLRRFFPQSSLWGNAALFKPTAGPVRIDWVSGACMMMRREAFEAVGGFSSDYFMYAEDSDLCFKARAQGYSNYYVGHAQVVHHGGGSSQRAPSDFSHIMMRESIARFLRKFHGPLYSLGYRLALSAAAAIRLALLALTLPVWLGRRSLDRWTAAFRKWLAILRWGLGFAPWARKAHPRFGVA